MADEMQHNATQIEDLTPAQHLALEALLAGRTVTDAAAAAQVDRTTLHRWLKDDMAFQAAFNRGKRELRDAAHVRLMQVAAKAVDCVEQAVESRDAKTALAVLRGLGLLDGNPEIGSDDPATLASERAEREFLSGFTRICRT